MLCCGVLYCIDCRYVTLCCDIMYSVVYNVFFCVIVCYVVLSWTDIHCLCHCMMWYVMFRYVVILRCYILCYYNLFRVVLCCLISFCDVLYFLCCSILYFFNTFFCHFVMRYYILWCVCIDIRSIFPFFDALYRDVLFCVILFYFMICCVC